MSNNKDTSFIEYNVEQPTQDFVTNFDTIGGTTDVVLVTVDGVLTDEPESAYTAQQINLNTWRITPEVPVGSVVRLYRVTDIDEMMHVFTAGAKFIARNMDDNFKQIRHSQQEVQDNFSKLEADTDVRLGAFSDRVDALNTEFLTTQDVVDDLVTTSAITVNTANTAFNTANAIDAKASTALSNSSTALSIATGIDAKATDALDNSLDAVLDAASALSTANGIDAKATQALADSATALSSATTALNTANAIDDKATQALTNSTGALKSSNNLSDVASATKARANLGVMSSSEVATAIANSVPNVEDATTTNKGVVRLATESDITNPSETVAVTPKNVADMLVGIGSLAKGFRALFSARLTEMTGTNTSSARTITCTITAHGLSVGDVVRVNYNYKANSWADQRATDTVVVTSVANANTFTFTSPQTATGSAGASACTLYYAIKNNYNVNSLAINSVGRYTISINTASGITGTSFIPFIQATTSDNSLVIVQPEAITSATSLTVRTFNTTGAAITPQWLHIGVTQ